MAAFSRSRDCRKESEGEFADCWGGGFCGLFQKIRLSEKDFCIGENAIA